MEFVQIKDIRAGQKNINVMFIVLEVSHPTITKENREVRTFKVADPTACMNVSIWDEPGQLLMPGDIVRLTKGYASVWRQCLTLYSGKNGEIQKVGEFCMAINEQVNMSDPNPMLAQQMVNQSGSGPPGSNVNNTITNNGNANSISGQTGRQSSLVHNIINKNLLSKNKCLAPSFIALERCEALITREYHQMMQKAANCKKKSERFEIYNFF